MLSDLCERDDHGACFDDELDGCRCECHPDPLDCPAVESTGDGRAQDAAGPPSLSAPASAIPRSAAGRPLPGPAPTHPGRGTPSSPRLRERADAAETPGPETAPSPPLLGKAAVRARAEAPAPATGAVQDRVPAPGRVPDNAPTESARASQRVADSVLSAGQAAIAAAMSEDRGPDSLDAHVRRMFKDLGLKAYHTRTSVGSAKGYPDWTICGDRVIFRELKTQRRKVTPEQQAWLHALVLAEQDACVWRPADLLSGLIGRQLAALAGLRAGAA